MLHLSLAESPYIETVLAYLLVTAVADLAANPPEPLRRVAEVYFKRSREVWEEHAQELLTLDLHGKNGARFKVRFGTRLTEFEIVDFAPPNTFGWVERGQRRGSKTFFRLDFVGGSTAVTVRDVWTPHSLGAWVQGRLLPKRRVHRQLKAILQNLQHLLSP